jgi:hypothetical protein
MQFVINRDDNLMSIDNALIDLNCSALASNISLVAYTDAGGKITYNDRPSMRETFTDPAPYQTLINSWITAAAAATPALQLAQAKQVKNDLIFAIYRHKHRLPYSYSGHLWDASDEAVANNAAFLTAGSSAGAAGLVPSINGALAAITNQINGQIVAVNNGSAAQVNAWSAGHAANLNSMVIQITTAFLTDVVATAALTPGLGSGGFSAMSAIAGATVSGGGAAGASIVPPGESAPISFSSGTINAAYAGIATRRNDLNNNSLIKQAAVNALTTIPAVVAYDATTGWSS